MNQQQIRDFFALNHTRPKKQLGQNFLVNPEVLKIILEAGELSDADTVIEIGAGLGCLTDVVVQHAKHVIAIEVDELLYNVLASQFSTNPRVQLLNTDILKLELNSLLLDGTRTVPTTLNRTEDGTRTVPTTLNRTEDGTRTVPTTFKVIANLPYSITTPILRKLLAHYKQIHSCVLMMQKEVAERIVAGPGGKDYGALTIGVDYYAEATLIATLSPENFYPAPKVDSALLKLTMREKPKVAVEDEDLFFKVVRTAFRTRRKMLKNALVRGRFVPDEVLTTAFSELGIAPQRRAETLDITEFAALANFLSQSVAAKTGV